MEEDEEALRGVWDMDLVERTKGWWMVEREVHYVIEFTASVLMQRAASKSELILYLRSLFIHSPR